MFRLPITALIVVSLTIESLAAGPLPPKGTAVVSADPSTSVSGTMVMDKMAVFPEDEVETHSDKIASLTFAGTSLNVLGKSHIKLHIESADLLSGGTTVSTTNRFMIQSSCFSTQPVAAVGSPVAPLQGRIYIYAEQGDLLVKTRRDVRVPAAKTVAITSCGKPSETVRLVAGSSLPYIAFGSAIAAGLIMPFVIPRDKRPISAGSPASGR